MAGQLAVGEVNGNGVSTQIAQDIDPQILIDHLALLLQVTLGATSEELQHTDSLLGSSRREDTLKACARFAQEAKATSIYIQKLRRSSSISDEEDEAEDVFSYQLHAEQSYEYSNDCVGCIAVMKPAQPIDTTRKITSQVRVVELPVSSDDSSASRFEGFYNLLNYGLIPSFNAYVKNKDQDGPVRGKGEESRGSGVTGAKKKMAELALNLQQLRDNEDIPVPVFHFNHEIQRVLDLAKAQRIPPSIDLLDESLISDSAFILDLQRTVNHWIREIQATTDSAKREPTWTSATQEKNFWLRMESVLEDIEQSLSSEGVSLTLDVLRKAKRFTATVSFQNDTDLKKTAEMVSNYNILMRDFPLDELKSAPSLEKVQEALGDIFSHLNKKIRLCNYPIRRALALVEAISGDFDLQMHTRLNGKQLMHYDYATFVKVMREAEECFIAWESHLKDFTNAARDTSRKRNEKFIPIKVTPRHTTTQLRLEYIHRFRRNHEQLHQTILNAITPSKFSNGESESIGVILSGDFEDADPVEEVSEAYAALKGVDVLDISEEGTTLWTNAETTYNDRTSRVENSIIRQLRDLLGKAKNANEMFRVFSKFNALFVRPKIRSAVSEYQSQLIENVKRDIQALHDRFKEKYGFSEAYVMSQLHDIPPIAGSIIWARQIERHLDNYMRKVEDILGPDWHMHTAGEKLQTESNSFRKKLETKKIFDTWYRGVMQKNTTISGRLFNIHKARAAGNSFQLTVNFDGEIISLFKEVRHMSWLRFQIPNALKNIAKEAKNVYPFAVSLMETVHQFTQTTQTISAMSDVALLLNVFQNSAYSMIAKGMFLKWESFVDVYDLHTRVTSTGTGRPEAGSKHVQFVRDFGSAVSVLQRKTALLEEINSRIQMQLKNLESCPYTAHHFKSSIDAIQKDVDMLELENYSNRQLWVDGLNDRIEATLANRLKQAISEWIEVFDSTAMPIEEESNRPRRESDPNSGHLEFKQLTHEISIRNQTLYLKPPLEMARSTWLQQLQSWIGIVGTLQKVKGNRYDMTLAHHIKEAVPTFSYLPDQCALSLATAHDAISKKISEVSQYVATWLQFQSLWDLRREQLFDEIQEDLARWLQLLQEIVQARSTFDTSEKSQSFGNITVKYDQVQVKVNAQYDQWQHDIVARFATLISGRKNIVFTEIQQARKELESQRLEASSTQQAVTFITVCQKYKRMVKAWEEEVGLFRLGETSLMRQRFQTPKGWLSMSQIDDQWSAFQQILNRQSKIVQDQSDALRAKIEAEDQVVNQKIADINVQWSEEKPVSGNMAPAKAEEVLQSFETRLAKLRDEAEGVSKAKEALDLAPSAENMLPALLEEVQDFRSVWASLNTIWLSLNELREQQFSSVNARKVKGKLNELVKMMKDMPSRMRQYAAFTFMQDKLRNLLKANSTLSDLRSEAMRDRHWAKIFKSLGPSKRFSSSMTLGDVWDLNLVASEVVIRDVFTQAQGEMGLEEFLRQVKETWQNYMLDLVNYQNKCRLIRGWDDLFAKCSEHLNSLQMMRNSPYYREFQQEAVSWEDRLNQVHVLFDVWIDVQRQWVYLEGVFMGNADIKYLLKTETAHFKSINQRFFEVMKHVSKSPLVLDVLAIDGVQTRMEELAALLTKIQKALGEYLEKERTAFPRFYFVGDEDLLEIIGNSNDPQRVSKHLRKMFAGIASLLTTEDSIIEGFFSKEGERIFLNKEISLAKTPKVNEWLGLLESSMKTTLASLLFDAVGEYTQIINAQTLDRDVFQKFVDDFPAQIVVLASQVCWTTATEAALQSGSSALDGLYERLVGLLQVLASAVLGDLTVLQRKKCEHLITEFVHQRDVVDKLRKAGADPHHYLWLTQMRYVYQPEAEPLDRLHVKMANASIVYGYEYLGVPDRLVRTPLTDRCFLTLTQALSQRLGGSPYGPAGTGKTESVKALGLQLGRFTLVFCCDDTFDFQAMGRIFLGICKVGAWGCFDEFNRLEERILSAVSQQIQNIQQGLRRAVTNGNSEIELIGRNLQVHGNTGIFITMNPGYAGRSNLPDNLKKLFRSVAMSKPDKELIAEVMLYSQGFSCAKDLSRQIVPFFDRCAGRLSNQSHYDFGLRALKSVLVSSGGLKRDRLATEQDDSVQDTVVEPQIIVQSIRETLAPKLIRSDVEIMIDVEYESFPGVEYIPAPLEDLQNAIKQEAAEAKLVPTDSWMTKVIQLYQIQRLHHGVMMVGSSGSGKSTAWRILLKALQRVDGIEGVCHVIDPKVMSKEHLYGTLDPTTREWTDGLFTSILRKIIDNLRGEDSKRHWIVFDGDVDPVWVENLNSVLDDNKMLTLPNGERLNLPSNVRIMFEVETLKYATLATVSRCGMVWFSSDVVDPRMIVANFISNLSEVPFDDIEDSSVASGQLAQKLLATQKQTADYLQAQFADDNFIQKALEEARGYRHIMEFTDIRALNTLFSLLNKACRNILEYNAQHSDFTLEDEQIRTYISKKLLLSLIWSLTGDCPLADRKAFGDSIAGSAAIDLPTIGADNSIIDYDVVLPRSEWEPWQNQVTGIEVDTHSVTDADVVIPTLDTVRHEDILYSWLAEHKPLILCGPPGSGKTMTLFNALKKLEQMEVIGLNFSSATTPDLLIKTLEQYCGYRKTPNGVMMTPTQVGRWLVIFCDEINLPAPDDYGTPRAISFLRQLVEQNGFWRTSDRTWVTLDRIQFVGACNPPTDPGRTPLGLRFLRHAPVIMVDYPGEQSLHQIYGTFTSAVLKIVPSLRGYAELLTKAMVQVFSESQKRFTPDIQPHYIYSPRELTRWVRGIYEAIRPLDTLSLEGLIRIWAHEALRLFQDRLIDEDERKWTESAITRIALEYFPTLDQEKALAAPILFSSWDSKNYVPIEREKLREIVNERLKTFCEEEVDVKLIPFNDLLEHVLRIDRVFRQSQGHLILIGVSGSGKTTLSRFVAWMNGLSVYQIKLHGKYSAEDFDDDLRAVLRRCGCQGEKICFIMDESNVLDSGFLERMNTLLANAEIPGLFEGDEFTALMTQCREGAQREGDKGHMLDSNEELYKWFKSQIAKNLHVVFTMNPPQEGLSSKAATSPALFNRCVLNWFGDWSDQALFQVGSELTQSIDLDRSNYQAPNSLEVAYRELSLPPSHREAVVNAMVHIHYSLHGTNESLLQQQNKVAYLTPRHFLDFVDQFAKLHSEKREDLEEQQRHINVGLDKLRDTKEKVEDLNAELAEKRTQLKKKGREAEEKLTTIISDEKTAEKEKRGSEEVQIALQKQQREVAEREAVVREDLAKAEPAVAEAKRSVGNIKKAQLQEIRGMTRPPMGVKLTVESVCMILGHKQTDWNTLMTIMRRDDFIASIVNYDNDSQMTKSLRSKMRHDYLSKEEFTFERASRASKACGPLVQWVTAQVEYGDIKDRVAPLQEELKVLQEKMLNTRSHAQAIDQEIQRLEDSIGRFKGDYAALISEVEAIKAEMKRVESKVERSERLLASLGSEEDRWKSSSQSFDSQIDTLVGDVLVSAALMAYGGFYDQQYRKAMTDDWYKHLSSSGIRIKDHNPVTEYLSTADERLAWQQHSLPVDDLCTENAIMLKRFNRYPLIIDPSGRVTEFLQQEYKHRKLTVTSFLDNSFTKQLETSLRFGNPILIQDAEHLDPILTHILNKEYQKTGGRVLINVGKQEVDFSPSFKLFLSTRDPSASFAPDICSRTTLVNFTVTKSSLQTQCLNEVLKSERPDVDERRSNVIKMQGEFKLKLRNLEKLLLQALNESQGNILDDDKVLKTLEDLKKEAGVITEKAKETEGVWSEVESITSQYSVIAGVCAATFATLEQLHRMNHFYQFSLQYFMDIFQDVLKQVKKSSESNNNARIEFIIRELFINTYRRTSLAMVQKDRVALAMLLAQATPETGSFKMEKGLIDMCLREDLEGRDVSTDTSRQNEAMAQASQLQIFKDYISSVNQSSWDSFFTEELAEDHVPKAWPSETSTLDQHLRSLILVKLFRVDRFVPAVERFVEAVFGANLLDTTGDLGEVVQQVSARTPISLSSSPGFDASYRVDNLVERTNATCTNIAMGSNEGLATADKAIGNAAATGAWVLIKNVHLAPTWLQSLEKRIDSLKPHPDFRLFLCMDASPKIPVNLLRASRILMNEQPAGIRANMKDSLSSLSAKATKAPVERARVYLLLAMLHAVVQERLRYVPIGWKGFWEFNDSDYECCSFIIDAWIESFAGGRTNISPKNIPWDMLRMMITEMYGGKIDDEGDFQTLSTIVDNFMTPAAFDADHNVLQGLQSGPNASEAVLLLPDGTTWNDFMGWVRKLPEREPPTYLGLPGNAEKLLLVGQAKQMMGNLSLILGIMDQ
ncbi:cytoplasmic dynein-like protein 1 heavy chain 1 [Microthyrium microscopicum]|uniref:Dynein heavy chain, cytoplasmic n=1 Tax=Microthyrium microscopicum TaxID=703497 RepID=A0A6A6UKZ0_9PEZI|nr:cytoplasmic dynein-like protein 1 heavy chain 1 [Microthyrium microscopicum]